MPKEPQRPSPTEQGLDRNVYAKPRGQRAMRGGIVRRDRLIEVRPAFRNVSREH